MDSYGRPLTNDSSPPCEMLHCIVELSDPYQGYSPSFRPCLFGKGIEFIFSEASHFSLEGCMSCFEVLECCSHCSDLCGQGSTLAGF